MRRVYSGAVFSSVVVLLLIVPMNSNAFETYSTDGSTGNCANCHGDFRGDNYTSNSDGTAWNDHLMGGHESFIGDNGNDQCDVCHSGNNRSPTYLALSDLAAKPNGCVGCHGREQDITANDGIFGGPNPGRGDGLRANHMGSTAYTNWPGGATSTPVMAPRSAIRKPVCTSRTRSQPWAWASPCKEATSTSSAN